MIDVTAFRLSLDAIAMQRVDFVQEAEPLFLREYDHGSVRARSEVNVCAAVYRNDEKTLAIACAPYAVIGELLAEIERLQGAVKTLESKQLPSHGMADHRRIR